MRVHRYKLVQVYAHGWNKYLCCYCKQYAHLRGDMAKRRPLSAAQCESGRRLNLIEYIIAKIAGYANCL